MKEDKTYIFSAFGTDNEIKLWDFDVSLQKQLFLMIEKYESELSYYRKESFVTKINENAGISFTTVNKEVVTLIKIAMKYYEKYKVFNILLKSIQMRYMQALLLPSLQRRKDKKLIQMKDIKIDDTKIMLKKQSMQLDLGGIAKGYIVDKIVAFLKENAVTKGIVNCGGDIYTWNNQEESFHVGIKNPFVLEAEYIVVLSLVNESISTSGIYERFNKNNNEFHHIINPLTMQPSDSELISVSVIGKKAIDTDVLATIFLILGREQSVFYIHKYKLDCGVVFMTKKQEVYASRNIKNMVIDTTVSITYE